MDESDKQVTRLGEEFRIIRPVPPAAESIAGGLTDRFKLGLHNELDAKEGCIFETIQVDFDEHSIKYIGREANKHGIPDVELVRISLETHAMAAVEAFVRSLRENGASER